MDAVNDSDSDGYGQRYRENGLFPLIISVYL